MVQKDDVIKKQIKIINDLLKKNNLNQKIDNQSTLNDLLTFITTILEKYFKLLQENENLNAKTSKIDQIESKIDKLIFNHDKLEEETSNFKSIKNDLNSIMRNNQMYNLNILNAIQEIYVDNQNKSQKKSTTKRNKRKNSISSQSFSSRQENFKNNINSKKSICKTKDNNGLNTEISKITSCPQDHLLQVVDTVPLYQMINGINCDNCDEKIELNKDKFLKCKNCDQEVCKNCGDVEYAKRNNIQSNKQEFIENLEDNSNCNLKNDEKQDIIYFDEKEKLQGIYVSDLKKINENNSSEIKSISKTNVHQSDADLKNYHVKEINNNTFEVENNNDSLVSEVESCDKKPVLIEDYFQEASKPLDSQDSLQKTIVNTNSISVNNELPNDINNPVEIISNFEEENSIQSEYVEELHPYQQLIDNYDMDKIPEEIKDYIRLKEYLDPKILDDQFNESTKKIKKD